MCYCDWSLGRSRGLAHPSKHEFIPQYCSKLLIPKMDASRIVNFWDSFLDERIAVLTCLKLGFFLMSGDLWSEQWNLSTWKTTVYTVYLCVRWLASLLSSFPYVLWFQWWMIVLIFTVQIWGEIRKRFPIWRAHFFLDICGYVLHYTFGTWFQLLISVNCYPFE